MISVQTPKQVYLGEAKNILDKSPIKEKLALLNDPALREHYCFNSLSADPVSSYGMYHDLASLYASIRFLTEREVDSKERAEKALTSLVEACTAELEQIKPSDDVKKLLEKLIVNGVSDKNDPLTKHHAKKIEVNDEKLAAAINYRKFVEQAYATLQIINYLTTTTPDDDYFKRLATALQSGVGKDSLKESLSEDLYKPLHDKYVKDVEKPHDLSNRRQANILMLHFDKAYDTAQSWIKEAFADKKLTEIIRCRSFLDQPDNIPIM
ncbi:hypothetical protein JXA85_08830 [Candidatus Woesearchaeota archaeon]|nr:hypothetical protein [Candidatus Woesearchaeota archaeon]